MRGERNTNIKSYFYHDVAKDSPSGRHWRIYKAFSNNFFVFYSNDKIPLFTPVYIPTTKITYENENKWVGDMITAVLIEVLSSMAEQERLKIRKRQAEGIAIAKKQGKKFGRPNVTKPPNWNNVIIALDRGEITAVEAMKKLRLKKTSFYKLKNADKNAEMK